MRFFFYILICALSTYSGFSQFGPRQVINEDSGTIRRLRTADFDNDGDQDIVASSFDFVAWYENLDGNGNFSEAVAIQVGKAQSFSLFPSDLDGDGLIDLVVSYFDDDEVGWYRNMGGGSFSTIQLIAVNLQRASGVYAADLDGDDDLDLVLGVSNGTGLYWVENLDGLGNFSSLITINVALQQARTQVVGDIDGDGDNDILSNSQFPFLSWFENVDGLGSFSSQHLIDVPGLAENSIHMVDLDGDDDLDILSEKSDNIIWRENLDGLGNFGAFQVINPNGLNPGDVTSGDLDNDGDMDVLSCFSTGNGVIWHENEDGFGVFSAQITIDPDLQSPRTVQAADIDGDGDLDVVSAELTNTDRRLVWYENLTILNNHEIASDSFSLYPNPVSGVLQFETIVPVKQVRVFDMTGRLLLFQLGVVQELGVAHLNAGLLLIEITTDEGRIVKKVMKQ